MKRLALKLESLVAQSCRLYALQRRAVLAIVAVPVVLTCLQVVFMLLPMTRRLAMEMLQENRPVELLTVLFLIAGTVVGMRLGVRFWRGPSRPSGVFYVLFAAALFLLAMEEIAWGQWFFGFETPESMKDVNMQGEFTLHNIKGMQGHSEWLRLLFGLGGIVGIAVGRTVRFRRVGVPLVLLSYFLVVVLFASLDLYNDYHAIQPRIDKGLNKLSELLEMFIGMSGLMYLWMNGRRLKVEG